MTAETLPSPRIFAATCFISVAAMVGALHFHLLPSLLAGLLIFELVHVFAPRLQRHFSSQRTRLAAVVLLAFFVLGVSALAVVAGVAFFKSDAGSLPRLFAKMAEIVESIRSTLPESMHELIPVDPENLQKVTVDWLRAHSAELGTKGKEMALLLAHILVGMVIGALVSMHEALPGSALGPLGQQLTERARRLGDAFRRMVFAQIRISLLNTLFTSIYLAIALPLFGVHLPLTKTLIVVTFIAGMMPVIGNLISNTMIVVVSLAIAPSVALASLAFLVIIHKVEYFMNARIVGGEINARAWELLLAMLLMEAVFGLPGVVAAPIFYAWLKDELTRSGMI